MGTFCTMRRFHSVQCADFIKKRAESSLDPVSVRLELPPNAALTWPYYLRCLGDQVWATAGFSLNAPLASIRILCTAFQKTQISFSSYLFGGIPPQPLYLDLRPCYS